MEDMDVLGLIDFFLLQVTDSSADAEHICFKLDRNMFEFDYALVKDTQIIRSICMRGSVMFTVAEMQASELCVCVCDHLLLSSEPPLVAAINLHIIHVIHIHIIPPLIFLPS